jgi:hypothetical protein
MKSTILAVGLASTVLAGNAHYMNRYGGEYNTATDPTYEHASHNRKLPCV